ncbi:MAG TPA: hydroxymethylbilane synthase [Cyclobacteriaceae bacterium]|nr:hydroxymethylbilane synthase [Cyclobacteriaceae bacterium]
MHPIRLATRSSRLALWQANEVAARLLEQGVHCELVPVRSMGDIDLVSPIYEMGVQGVFTRELDIALLNNDADIAVHSLKDIPVVPAKGLTLAAVLPRGDVHDVLIHKGKEPDKEKFIVATSSIRRRSQWLERFPHHETVNIRGNVETRIQKLDESDFDGLIMAKAAIDRLEIDLPFTQTLYWMLPAPGQGAIAIVCRHGDEDVFNNILKINDRRTMIAVKAERDFLHELKGGCSAPISAYAFVTDDAMNFEAAVHSVDGKRSYRVEKRFGKGDFFEAGRYCAELVLGASEGRDILDEVFRSKPELGDG